MMGLLVHAAIFSALFALILLAHRLVARGPHPAFREMASTWMSRFVVKGTEASHRDPFAEWSATRPTENLRADAWQSSMFVGRSRLAPQSWRAAENAGDPHEY